MSAEKYQVELHAWVLMTNHVHLLATPQAEGAIGKLMQSLGRSYVRYFNSSYRRSGTLWEGRYRASLVESELYLLHLYRYIELNPVRADMVNDPAEYSWSSYPCNALGKQCKMHTPHLLWQALGSTDSERQESYQQLFRAHVDGPLLSKIRHTIQGGLALGSDRFIEQIERLTGQRISPSKRGRPKLKKEV
ncbi:MAG: transposase [Gammaproteobacteria bacterium]|nr:transposase [Gammaproteobacteria bacterium]